MDGWSQLMLQPNSRMEIRSFKNEDHNNVEALKKSTVVGKGFVKVPRRPTVSIVNKTAFYLTIISILIIIISRNFGEERNAATLVKIHQNLGEKSFSNKRCLGNFENRWQYFRFKNVNRTEERKVTILFKFFFKSKLKITKKKIRGKNLLLIKCGDIELNPGPDIPLQTNKTDSKGKILTYNVRGLKDYNKLKRILNSCSKLISLNRNTVINLQETHLSQ